MALQSMETAVHGTRLVSTPLPVTGVVGPGNRKSPDKQVALPGTVKRLLRFLHNCLDALYRDENGDRIDQIPQYRNTRMDAHHYSMFRSNR